MLLCKTKCKHSIADLISNKDSEKAGLEKKPVRSSGTSRFSNRASNYLFFFAQWAMTQASCSLTKFVIMILRRKGKL